MKPIRLGPPIKIWYKPLPGFLRTYWPVVDVNLSYKNISLPLKEGTSASGSYKYWVLPESIEVSIYGYSFGFKFSVIDNPGLIWPCILGENSIFTVARLDFQKFKNYFEIRFREDIN